MSILWGVVNVLWCTLTANANTVTAGAALVGSLATVVYLGFTVGIFLQTKKSADAAAQLAKLDAQLHRPYMGLVSASLVRHDITRTRQDWVFSWSFKNFGTLPASRVGILVNC